MDLPRFVASSIFSHPSSVFAVKLWDGSVLRPAHDLAPGSFVTVRRPQALAALTPPVSERRLAEAYMRGELDLEGEPIALLEAASQWRGPRAFGTIAALFVHEGAPQDRPRADVARFGARFRGRRHSIARDEQAVRHHYDRSDALCRLCLDPSLTYSCAYFAKGNESLEDAQRAKHELVCRKLELRPGERLLDVGCGWGALLAHATARYGVAAIGVTVSQAQYQEARRKTDVRACDYRTLRPETRFDKIASIGMMEHVGRRRIGEYFSSMFRLLQPGGLFLNQAIAATAPGAWTLPWVSPIGGSFIHSYIFPDSDLVPVGEVVRAAERAGFEVRDLESMREHYARTLAHWLSRFDARFDEACDLVGKPFARAFRLYLATSAVAFRTGIISVFQLLLAKPTSQAGAPVLPASRGRWYAAELST